MKNIILSIIVSIASFIMNFSIFTYSYNRVATPFLNEEQRVENAGYIMSVSLSLFVISSVIMGLTFYIVIRKRA